MPARNAAKPKRRTSPKPNARSERAPSPDVVVNITDLRPDARNANAGTVRGLAMLEDSISKYGAGRGILADKHLNIIAGNKTLQAAVDAGLKVKVVQTDGRELVVTQRTDLDLYTDTKARELAYADNRVAEIDLAWNAEALLADLNAGVDLSAMFDKDELDAILASVGGDEPPGADDNYSRKIDIPIYKPSAAKPKPEELLDRSRADTLIEEIRACAELTEAEREFLIAAASRHIVFNYAKVADFYAHSSAGVQRIMENSALVIIDFNRAIELGYVKLTQQIAALIGEENGGE